MGFLIGFILVICALATFVQTYPVISEVIFLFLAALFVAFLIYSVNNLIDSCVSGSNHSDYRGRGSGGSYSDGSGGGSNSRETGSTEEKGLPHQRAASSEKREDLITGKSFKEYQDEQGNRIGRTEKRESLFRGEYEQHIDEEGNKVGYSKKREDITGREYKQDYREDDSRAGRTETRSNIEEQIIGTSHEEHFDEEGNKTGESRHDPGFLGINDIFGEDKTKHEKEDD